MTEAAMLLEHGTAFVRLKPVNIVQAAEADLRLRARKEENKAEEGALYSFARQHVRKARSVEHLIALAYYEPWVAAQTDKTSTMIVYRDRDLLRETLHGLLEHAITDAPFTHHDLNDADGAVAD
jgi:glutamate synthase domain-containing protein 1